MEDKKGKDQKEPQTGIDWGNGDPGLKDKLKKAISPAKKFDLEEISK